MSSMSNSHKYNSIYTHTKLKNYDCVNPNIWIGIHYHQQQPQQERRLRQRRRPQQQQPPNKCYWGRVGPRSPVFIPFVSRRCGWEK